ncbi:hypothetical protein G7Y89_g8153 [Cudoniella acicularis]|uniref:NB-ARC domain-containing protein n=1 Tax=Cudoniella acicularis TaxID=354080 RepID=A0A8H4RJM4_9HELO|nr:hypothetical protein G7Y89_g8153 [Cudoniella acicularis]
MALIRLLQQKHDGEIGEEEVIFQDMEVNADISKTVNKARWEKIQFYAKQAAADGLQYFWEEALRKSRWFTRGWTLQELIAPRLVNFFSLEGERLGSKLSLESIIHKITGIAKNALRGDVLPNFSIKERMSWAERRNTTIEEDKAYCLIGVFDVSIVLNYGKRKDQAFRRLKEEIHKLYKGVDFEQFAVGLNLVSFPKATQFVARENELSKMHELLYSHSNRTCVVLYGLGGIGKTQLAIEYIRRHKEKYTAIFWLNTNDQDSLKLSFRDVAQQGSIIITTRYSRVSQGRRVYVQKLLDVKEGLEILSNTSGRKDIAEDPGAVELVKELDGLPLALSTAGAHLEHVSITLSDYLRLYKTLWLKLQTTSPQLESYEDRSLYTTWQITFDRIQQQNPASASLLKLWAYFDRQDIWFELLRHANSLGDGWIQELTKDELNFNKAVALLCSFGLVDPDRALQQQFGSGGYSVHSCVHSWTVFVLNKEWDEFFAQLALTCVALEIPKRDERNSWVLQQRLLQHAIRHEQFILEGKVDPKGIEWALDSLGHLWFDQGKLAEAQAMYTRALQGYEEALGPKHTSTLSAVGNLGNLYKDQGKLAEAQAMYTRALQGYEEALGPKHTSTLDTVNNLGNLYKDQGKLAEAEAIYTRALQGYEDALGPQLVPSYLPALNTMFAFGDLLSQTGRKDMAKGMYARALSGYTIVQGPSSKWCEQLKDRLQALIEHNPTVVSL